MDRSSPYMSSASSTMAVMGLSSSPPTLSPTPDTPAPTKSNSGAMNTFARQAHSHYLFFAKQMYGNAVKKIATEQGVHPDALSQADKQVLQKQAMQLAKHRVQQWIRSLRQKAFQQQAIAYNNPPSTQLPQQLPLPSLPFHPTPTPLQHNGVSTLSTAFAPDYSYQALPPLDQPVPFQTPPPVYRPTTMSPAPHMDEPVAHSSPHLRLQDLAKLYGGSQDDASGDISQIQEKGNVDHDELHTPENLYVDFRHQESQRDVPIMQDRVSEDGSNHLVASSISDTVDHGQTASSKNTEIDTSKSTTPPAPTSIDQIGQMMDAKQFTALKNDLSGLVRGLNTILSQRDHPNAATMLSLYQHKVVVALAEILSLTSGIVGLRNCLNFGQQETLFHRVQVATKCIPWVMPKAQAYVKASLESIICFESRWTTANKTIVEVYDQFCCNKADLIRFDRRTDAGHVKFAEELGVTRQDVWKYLAPAGDEALEE